MKPLFFAPPCNLAPQCELWRKLRRFWEFEAMEQAMISGKKITRWARVISLDLMPEESSTIH